MLDECVEAYFVFGLQVFDIGAFSQEAYSINADGHSELHGFLRGGSHEHHRLNADTMNLAVLAALSCGPAESLNAELLEDDTVVKKLAWLDGVYAARGPGSGHVVQWGIGDVCLPLNMDPCRAAFQSTLCCLGHYELHRVQDIQ